jgi:outer membrane protein OmpA-like peptidoglycan-associated protein
MQLNYVRKTLIPLSVLIVLLAHVPVFAADSEIKGVITARGDDGTVSVRTDDGTTLTLVTDDSTKVRRVDGMRRLSVTSSQLIPGLRVHASGAFDGTTRFVAELITFSRSEQKIAAAITGGVDPTNVRSLDNQQKIEKNRRTIDQQQQMLAAQAQQISANSAHIQANQEKIVATSGALNARITNLDDYNTISTVVVYFGNGKIGIDAKYKAELQQLVAQSKTITGYVFQVQGYASAVGSKTLNQTLSMRRADAVAAELQQAGIPPTNIVFPAAMGTTGQVATNDTSEGQAENRRTVVTLLQNKGLGQR